METELATAMKTAIIAHKIVLVRMVKSVKNNRTVLTRVFLTLRVETVYVILEKTATIVKRIVDALTVKRVSWIKMVIGFVSLIPQRVETELATAMKTAIIAHKIVLVRMVKSVKNNRTVLTRVFLTLRVETVYVILEKTATIVKRIVDALTVKRVSWIKMVIGFV